MKPSLHNFLYLVILVATGMRQIHADGIISTHHHTHEVPQPYKFGYEIKDKEGSQYRHESGDGHGTVRGSYGYVDSKGIHREVHYIADHNGFRANVITNEPGTANQDSANVHVQATPSHHIHPQHHIPYHQPIHHETHYVQPKPHQVHHEQYHPTYHKQYQTHQHHPKIHQHEPQFYHSGIDHGIHDIHSFDHHLPVHNYHHDLQHIPSHFKNHGHDFSEFWEPDFHHDDHYDHFGRYSTPSFVHYSLGGMGGHHF